jgi:hypothetical protein
MLVRPSLPLGAPACLVRARLRPSRPSLPLGRRHASFAQTVLACSETGASVRSSSLTAAARQLSSQAAELALRGMPRPHFRDGRMASTECHAVSPPATRRPQRPSGPALRGFGSREGGTNRVFGGGCPPRRATDESASEAGWSERVRAAMGPREQEDERGAHTRARGSGERARNTHPRPETDGAERPGGRTHHRCTRHPPDPG